MHTAEVQENILTGGWHREARQVQTVRYQHVVIVVVTPIIAIT